MLEFLKERGLYQVKVDDFDKVHIIKVVLFY